MKAKQSDRLTLKDRLSRLTYLQACKLLGPQGAELIRQGSGCDEVDLDRDVYLRGDLFRVKFPSCERGKSGAVVTITTMASARHGLRFNCTTCETICRHIGAAVSLVLEEKTALGLAAAPDESVPLENAQRSGADRGGPARAARAGEDREVPPPLRRSGHALDRLHGGQRPVGQDLPRGAARRGAWPVLLLLSRFPHQHPGHLQTHAHVLDRVRGRFPAAVRKKPYRNRETFVHLLYGEELDLAPAAARPAGAELLKAAGDLAAGPIDDVRRLVECVGRLQRLGHEVTVYPDAEELIQRRLFQQHLAERTAEIRRRTRSNHPLRTGSAEGRTAALSARGHRLCRGHGPGDPGRRHGPGQDHPGRGHGRASGPRGRHQQGAGGLPRLAQIAVAERNPPLLRPQRATGRGRRRPAGRASTTTTPSSPSATTSRCCATSCAIERDPLGPDHSRRGTADQELGVEDRPGHQGAEVALRPGAHRHAAGEPPGRALFGGAVRRRSPAAARPSASSTATAWSTKRERCWATRTSTSCGRTSGRSSAAAPASRCCSSSRRGRTEIVRIPPTDEQLELHGTHMRIVLDDHPQAVYQRDGPACGCKRRF